MQVKAKAIILTMTKPHDYVVRGTHSRQRRGKLRLGRLVLRSNATEWILLVSLSFSSFFNLFVSVGRFEWYIIQR
jgi:hypothetical protein